MYFGTLLKRIKYFLEIIQVFLRKISIVHTVFFNEKYSKRIQQKIHTHTSARAYIYIYFIYTFLYIYIYTHVYVYMCACVYDTRIRLHTRL